VEPTCRSTPLRTAETCCRAIFHDNEGKDPPQLHRPASFCVALRASDDIASGPKQKVGENVAIETYISARIFWKWVNRNNKYILITLYQLNYIHFWY